MEILDVLKVVVGFLMIAMIIWAIYTLWNRGVHKIAWWHLGVYLLLGAVFFALFEQFLTSALFVILGVALLVVKHRDPFKGVDVAAHARQLEEAVRQSQKEQPNGSES